MLGQEGSPSDRPGQQAIPLSQPCWWQFWVPTWPLEVPSSLITHWFCMFKFTNSSFVISKSVIGEVLRGHLKTHTGWQKIWVSGLGGPRSGSWCGSPGVHFGVPWLDCEHGHLGWLEAGWISLYFRSCLVISLDSIQGRQIVTSPRRACRASPLPVTAFVRLPRGP